jgi:tRNA threonylcarbamoyladenosine biosynthesis protein TsaE
VRLESLADTRTFAATLLPHLTHGALLLLDGPLGAGKTALVTELAQLLGSEAEVSSPTYTLIHEYPTPEGVLVHVDVYRLDGIEALLDLGLDDYLERARLVVVEWGAPLRASHPEALLVRIDRRGERRSAELIHPTPIERPDR